MLSSIGSKINYSQLTQEINTPDNYCVIPKIAIHAIRALGAILMAAGIASIIAGLEVPLVALLVAGAAAIILGFALDKVKPEEIKPVLELPSSNDPLSTPPIPFGNKTSIQHIEAPEEIPSLPANIEVDRQNPRDRICQPQAVLSQPIEIDTQYLTDLTDTDAAQGLVDFYKRLPKPQFNGPISDEPKDIQNWMKDSLEIRNCELLDLENLKLTKLPKEIGLFENLKILKLRKNLLYALPPEIGNLRSLTKLDVYDNKLQALPPEIGHLGSLTRFGAAYNQLQALPPQIGNLTSLTTLEVYGNQLPAPPLEIDNLEHDDEGLY